MVILDLLDISFHPAVVIGLGKNLLLKSVLGHCVRACLGLPCLGLPCLDWPCLGWQNVLS